MEPSFDFLNFKILYIFIIVTFLLPTDATFFNDDENFEYPEAVESIPPSEPSNGNPYGIPTPLSPPPLRSPALIPTPPLLTPPATPPLTVPPSPNVPIKSPPGKPTSPPSASPGPILPSPMGHPPPSSALPPPPPQKKPGSAVWCVAKPTEPDSVIQAALDYACGSGADCKAIQPNGPCFQPNTLVAHASYAFNSYWQNKKAAGGTCDFGGTAMLVSVDPSYDKCSFTNK